ncbi:MAG: Urea carboxylase-related amino acid permease [Conexibacter sp.]|nr:Urea carboxylase-related amino acid permease [Conexibacter sp.]
MSALDQPLTTHGADDARPAARANDSADLAALGYKPKLHRTMGAYTSFALAFSMVSINTGIITLFADPFSRIGGVAILIWLAIIPLVGTLVAVYAHLAGRIPLTGYAYQWSSRLVGANFGWFTGWVALISFLAGTAATAAAVGSVFAPEIWHDPSRGQIQLLSIGATVVVCVINVFGVRIATHVNNVGASIELAGTVVLGIVLLGGLLFFFGDARGPGVLVDTAHIGDAPITLTSVALAALLPVYVLLGWEGAADLSEETVDPRRAAPRAMIRSVVVSGAAGFVIFALLGMAIPGHVTTFLGRDGNPVFNLIDVQVGAFAKDIMVVIAFASIFACLIANMAVATRMVFALSRDNMLPGSRALAAVDDRTGTPIAAIIGVTVLAVVLNVLNAGLVAKIFAIVGLGYYATYLLTMIAALFAQRRGRIPAAPEGVFGLGRWLVPTAGLGVAWTVVVIVTLTVPKVNNTTAYYFAGAVAIGALWWAVALRGRLARGEAGPPDVVGAAAFPREPVPASAPVP